MSYTQNRLLENEISWTFNWVAPNLWYSRLRQSEVQIMQCLCVSYVPGHLWASDSSEALRYSHPSLSHRLQSTCTNIRTLYYRWYKWVEFQPSSRGRAHHTDTATTLYYISECCVVWLWWRCSVPGLSTRVDTSGPPLSLSSHWTHGSFRNGVFPGNHCCSRTSKLSTQGGASGLRLQETKLSERLSSERKKCTLAYFPYVACTNSISRKSCKIYTSKTWVMYGESGIDWFLDPLYPDVGIFTVKRKWFTLNLPLTSEENFVVGSFVCRPTPSD